MSLLFDFELIFYDHNNERDNFTSQLLRLIAKADPANMAKIERGFPEAVRLYKAWMNADPMPKREELEKFARAELGSVYVRLLLEDGKP